MSAEKKSRTIMFFFESPFFSGAEIQALQNAKQLAASGTMVYICLRNVRRLSDEIANRLENENIILSPINIFSRAYSDPPNKLIELIFSPFLFLSGFIFAMYRVGKIKPNAVHVVNGGFPGASGSRGFALGSTVPKISKVIMTVNNLAVPYDRFSRWMQKPVDFLLAKSKIVWVTASNAAANRLREVVGVRSENQVQIRNGVGRPICVCSQNGADSELYVDPDKVYFGQVGHLDERKGQEVLIKALGHLNDLRLLDSSWVFLIEGEGKRRNVIESLIEQKKLAGQVQLLGRVKCIFEIYDSISVLVHPSISYEDLPNVISEAMSKNLPIIASDVGGISEQVSNANGRLIEPGNYKELGQALISLMSDETNLKELAKESGRLYEKKFSEGLAWQEYKAIYFSERQE